VAEDLGFITPDVHALRHALGYPGMKILQFAFGGDGEHTSTCRTTGSAEVVVYTGTHDNDTGAGWWAGAASASAALPAPTWPAASTTCTGP
jgi:4-alpha-glucanotransferase